jgi:hypothetical protein
MAGQKTNAIIGGLSAIGAAIRGGNFVKNQMDNKQKQTNC